MTILTDILKYGLEYFGLFYGTYKAKVISNSDPDNRGRLIVHCPQAHGIVSFPSVWAEAKASMGGNQCGFWHVPDVGEWVYVQFDHGRVEYPIWDGGWWARGEQTTDMTAMNVVLVTKEGLKIVLNRTDKSVLVQQSDDVFVQLGTNQILVKAPFRVTVDSELQVTGGVHAGTGATGMFYSPTGQLVTVVDGIITSLE